MKCRNSNAQSPVAGCTGPRSNGSNSGRYVIQREAAFHWINWRGSTVWTCSRWSHALLLRRLANTQIFNLKRKTQKNRCLQQCLPWALWGLSGERCFWKAEPPKFPLSSFRSEGFVLHGKKNPTTLHQMEFNWKGLFIQHLYTVPVL